MIITLRTVPRDTGETSVVLTRSPGDPRDPEIMGVFVTSRAAIAWMLEQTTRICAKAGDRCTRSRTTYDVKSDGPSVGTVRLDLEIESGEELLVE